MSLTGAEPVSAHVVLERTTLRQSIQHSSAALLVEFLSDVLVWTASDASDRQEYFRVRRLEVLSGATPSEEFEFFPHAEGFSAFRKGDRALLFLELSQKRAEFSSLAARFPYFSLQGAGGEWVLRGDDASAILELARGYAAWLRAPPGAGPAGLRSLLIRQLGWGVSRLQSDAISELIRVRRVPGLFDTAADVEPILRLIAADHRTNAKALSMGARVALVQLFEGRAGFDTSAQWQVLIQRADSATEKRALIRAARGQQDATLSNWLASQLGSDDPGLRREAASALGRPWHADHQAALVAALEDLDPGVVRAAIDALAALGGELPRRKLQALAAGEDRKQARWAAAALRRLDP